MTSRGQEEQDLRIDYVTISIEKLRTDIADQVNQRRIEETQREVAQRWEARKFVVQMVVGAAACVAAGATLATLFLHLAGKV